MRDRFTDPRHDVVAIPTIWVAILLSLLVHLAVVLLLWVWKPEILFPSTEGPDRGKSSGSLMVRLAPQPSPSPAPPPAPATVPKPSPAPQARPAPPPAPKPAPQVRPPKAPPRPAPAPPVLALNKPSAKTPVPSAPPAPPMIKPAPKETPPAEDFSSMLEARRRARNESAPPPAPASAAEPQPPVEDAAARTQRLVAANLGTDRTPTFGSDPTRGGGIFQIKRLGYDDAEFVFFGWNRDIRRNTAQTIEVRRGNNSDIRIAVVRRIIGIIREYEQEDFLWESRRLGRNLTLSARAKDTAGLEAFLMREFFDGVQQ
ncbi:MAG: hypothetical protein U1E63_16045 [Burkholderiales bacterium]